MMDTNWYYNHYFFWMFPGLLSLVIVELILKAIALWKAGRNNQLYWFIALVVFNTAGILPVIYLLFFQAKEKRRK